MVVNEKNKRAVSVLPFGIEATNPRNGDLFVKGISQRLRSRISPTKDIFDREDGEQVIRPVDAKLIDGLPRNLRGMQLHVNPAECTWKVIDPLHGKEEVLDKIKQAMVRNAGYSINGKLKGVPPKEGTLDIDQMKTLVREMVQLIEAGDAEVIKGVKPEMEDVEELPGDFLLNPINLGNWNQPRYEKDVEEWKRKLNTLG